MDEERPVVEYKSAEPKRQPRQIVMIILLVIMTLLLLVIVAGVFVPVGERPGSVEEAKRWGTITEIANLSAAVEEFKTDVGRYPTSGEGLEALVRCPAGVTGWRGPYCDEVPVDKWGTAYRYVCPVDGDATKFAVISAGSDKVFGTADDIDWGTGTGR